jgi:hypothetical protein
MEVSSIVNNNNEIITYEVNHKNIEPCEMVEHLMDNLKKTDDKVTELQNKIIELEKNVEFKDMVSTKVMKRLNQTLYLLGDDYAPCSGPCANIIDMTSVEFTELSDGIYCNDCIDEVTFKCFLCKNVKDELECHNINEMELCNHCDTIYKSLNSVYS